MKRWLFVVALLLGASCRKGRTFDRFVSGLQVHRDTACACESAACADAEEKRFDAFMDDEIGTRVVSMKGVPDELRERILRLQQEADACRERALRK